MRTRVVFGVLCAAIIGLASPAHAQYKPNKGASDRATGENYHFEASGDLWGPTPEISIASESLPGVIGDRIDFVKELGIVKKTFRQIKLVGRPSKKAKFRFEYTPIHYEADASPTRTIIFNGIAYPITLPVHTDVTWRAYRFTFEYDFLYKPKWFLGLILEAKYTDVEAALTNIIDNEFVHARAPIPAIGGILRVYPVKNVGITTEISGIKLPEGINEDYRAKYVDVDIYGTVNFTENFGAQLGYRSFDVFYRVKDDEGAMTIKGPYFGGVVRF